MKRKPHEFSRTVIGIKLLAAWCFGMALAIGAWYLVGEGSHEESH